MKLLFALLFSLFSLSSMAQTADSKDKEMEKSVPAEKEEPQHLRKRQHNLEFDYTQSSAQLIIPSSTTNSTSFNMQVTYAYNMGHLQPFIGFASSYDNNTTSGDKTDVNASVFGLRYNITENKPGNDLIPFVSFGFMSSTVDSVDSGTASSISGNGTAFSVGLTWYPFSQIFAINVGFVSSSLSVSGTGITGDSNLRTTSLLAGYMISF